MTDRNERKPVGRPRTVMTEEAKAKIVKAVRLGLWPDRAAEMHGIHPGTMRKERKRDAEFATALKRAEAEAEAAVHSKILRHMDRQWTACAWMLERRWPSRWSKQERLVVSTRGEAEQLLADLAAIRSINEAKPDAAS